MAKITKDFYKQMAERMPKFKTVEASVGEEKYFIQVKNYLSMEEKTEMITKLFDLTNHEEIKEDSAGVFLMILIYETITDIEFPEDLEGRLNQITMLTESGVMEQVKKHVRPGLVEDLLQLVNDSLESLNELADKKIEGKQK